MIEPPTGTFLAAARCRARLLLTAAIILSPAAAQAQMLRGSFETLPGQDEDFSPYEMSPAPDTGFEPPPFERIGEPQEGAPTPLPPADPASRRRAAPEADPYAQLGIRAGAFIIKPSIEIYGGYDTNPNSSDPPEGSERWRSQTEIDVESDWIRHAFRGRIEHVYRAFEEFPDLDGPTYSADAALRLDARDDLRLDFSLRGVHDTESNNSDPDLDGTSGRVDNTYVGGSASLTYKPNRLSVTPRFEAARRVFEEESGIEDRTYNSFEYSLRTGYELSPAVEPFVEASYNERIYDEPVNEAGLEHDSWGWRGYAGVRFEPNPIWAAEAKVGYGIQDAEDAGQDAAEGVVAQGSLIWRPSELTSLRLNAERDFSASARDSTAVTDYWRVGAEFEHEFRRWLILTGEFGFSENSYPGDDEVEKNFDAELALEYKFNRTVSAKGSVSYETSDSTDDDDDYEATTVEIGLRVQR